MSVNIPWTRFTTNPLLLCSIYTLWFCIYITCSLIKFGLKCRFEILEKHPFFSNLFYLEQSPFLNFSTAALALQFANLPVLPYSLATLQTVVIPLEQFW